MVPGQALHREQVGDANGQKPRVKIIANAGRDLFDACPKGQLSEAALDGNLPKRRDAHRTVAGRIGDGPLYADGQAVFVRKRPQNNVGVQQKSHR